MKPEAEILLLSSTQVRSLVTMEEAIASMESAFAAYSRKEANVPPVMHLDVPEQEGEVHIKAGHIRSTPEYVLKVAAGFWTNRDRGLPVGSGLMLVFSAETGNPLAALLDNGYLTDLRTAAAGAVASKYMALPEVEQVAVFGAGVQGRLQLQALACVRPFKRAVIYDHRHANIAKYLEDMRDKTAAELKGASSPEEAARAGRILIAATPSRQPYIRAEWIEPGTHITAMGSDDPAKQELEAEVLAKADRIVADSLPQCLRLGEIHHAVEQGLIRPEDVDGELGDVILGHIPGRVKDHEITVADLTGVGVQDAAIAQLVYRRAVERKIGTRFRTE